MPGSLGTSDQPGRGYVVCKGGRGGYTSVNVCVMVQSHNAVQICVCVCVYVRRLMFNFNV